MLLDAPVALAFWGALVNGAGGCSALLLVAAIVALALLGLHLYAIFNTPLYLLPALSGITHLGLAGSEILPRWPRWRRCGGAACYVSLCGRALGGGCGRPAEARRCGAGGAGWP